MVKNGLMANEVVYTYLDVVIAFFDYLDSL